MTTMDELKRQFPPSTPIVIWDYQKDKLDEIRKSFQHEQIPSYADIVGYLLNYYEARERIDE